jgi:hypothetical protein
MEQPAGRDQLEIAAPVFLIQRLEIGLLLVLDRERAHQPHAGEILLHACRDRRELRLDGLEAVVDALAEVPH